MSIFNNLELKNQIDQDNHDDKFINYLFDTILEEEPPPNADQSLELDIDIAMNNILLSNGEIDFENDTIKKSISIAFNISEDQVSMEALIKSAQAGVDKIIKFASRTWFFLKRYYLTSTAKLEKQKVQLKELEYKIYSDDVYKDNKHFLEKKVKLITRENFEKGLDLYRGILSEIKPIMSVNDFEKKINSSLGITDINQSYSQIIKLGSNGKSAKNITKNLEEAFSKSLINIISIINKHVKPNDYEELFGLKVRKGTSTTTADVLEYGIPTIFKMTHGSATIAGLGYKDDSFAVLRKKLVDVYPNYGTIKSVYEELEKEYYALSDIARKAAKLGKNDGKQKEIAGVIVKYLLYKKMILDAKKMTISKPISNLKRLTKHLFKLGYIQLQANNIAHNNKNE